MPVGFLLYFAVETICTFEVQGDEDIRCEVDHVLLTAATRLVQQITQIVDGAAHNVT